MLAMLNRHGFHRRGIIPDKTIDGLSIAQMLIDDFRYIGGLHTPVPDALWVNDYHGAFLAQAYTPAGGKLHIAAEVACLYLAIYRGKHCERTIGRAGWDTFRFLLRTDEEMNAERFHRELQS
jgi:hypothetical protein